MWNNLKVEIGTPVQGLGAGTSSQCSPDPAHWVSLASVFSIKKKKEEI